MAIDREGRLKGRARPLLKGAELGRDRAQRRRPGLPADPEGPAEYGPIGVSARLAQIVEARPRSGHAGIGAARVGEDHRLALGGLGERFEGGGSSEDVRAGDFRSALGESGPGAGPERVEIVRRISECPDASAAAVNRTRTRPRSSRAA